MGAAKKLKIYKPPDTMIAPPPKFAERHKAFLLALQHAGKTGLTDFELAGVTNTRHPNAASRRKELQRMSLVVSTGNQRKLPTGRNAIIWRITSKGIKKAQSLLRSEK